MTSTKSMSSNVAIAATVVLLIAASALLLPSLLKADSDAQPRNTTVQTDVALQSTIPADLTVKLTYMGLEFDEGVALKGVTVPQAEGVAKATAEFGGITKGVSATIAAVGSFTNTTYGKAREDGTPEPSIVDRPTWIVVYKNVPQTNDDQLGGGVLKETKPFTAYTDFAVFVDATTGEVLGATTLLDPEEQPSNHVAGASK